MSRFDSYFLMNVDDVIEYTLEKIGRFNWDRSSMHSVEIGDGNLNYVFRVWDDKGNSVIIKHAGVALRISKEMHISTERNRIESEVLILQNKLAPGLVPKIYFYDTVMCACAMQDLTGHELMRYALIKHKIFPKFVEDITTYMANTLMGTTDICMDHKQKKDLQKKFINPELCEITEDLIYTEPYDNHKDRNNVYPPNADFVRKELYEDDELKLEVAKLKFDFMANGQALIHGDLHTGSIFVKPDSTYIFDPEFAFYGPIGYDTGNIIANMIFALCNGNATIESADEKVVFCDWVEKTIVEIIDLLMEKMRRYYDGHVTEPMAKVKGFEDWYLKNILADTSAVTGLELNRRIVGMANVKDITTIPSEEARARAERICILCAKRFIKERRMLKNGADFLKILKDVEASVK